MTTYPFTQADLERLKQWDTPTICNGLELIVPERRAIGFTVEPMAVLHPDAAPLWGWHAPERFAPRSRRAALWPTASTGTTTWPRLHFQPSWRCRISMTGRAMGHSGEVKTTVHMKLGAEGCVTNGSFRDLSASAKGFQILGGRVGPSHAHIHVVDFGGAVNIFGMQAAHDDVIHADCHGAVVVPAECVTKLPAAIDLVTRREKVILDLCASPGFTPASFAKP